MLRSGLGFRLWVLFLTTLILVSSERIPVWAETVEVNEDFRAVWVSTLANLDFPSKQGLSNDEMKEEIRRTVDRAADMGLNAIILQVRPCGDALYASGIFPWSEYITGVQGAAPADGFDPLAYWIEQAHQKGLELHGWINPFRAAKIKIMDVNALAPTNPARQNPGWIVAYKDALYFNPGLPACQALIAEGVAEIVRNYDVDGIHLDDYFYPGADFPDSAAYAQYGGDLDLEDWRRENINELVKKIQKTVKEIKPEVRFGVSPAAIWQNASSDPLGSDTRGSETYRSVYADTRRWVKEGWLDYICPQIYWHIGFEVADYEKVLYWWMSVCEETDVDLYIGHAAYKEAWKATGWQSGEIIRQLQTNALFDEVKGSVFFRMSNLNGEVGEQLKIYYGQPLN